LHARSAVSRLENAPSKTEAARLTAALLDQFATTVTPGQLEILDIDDTFCAAHGGQQLAFWNAHHDERGFASMHIYHVTSGTPVATILRPARTPKGTEVRTVIKHVTKRLRTHWPNTRIVWRGDSHYGRVEAMEWAEDDGVVFSASPAIRRSMPWWPRPPTICASITPRAASPSCAPMRASSTRPAAGHGRARWWPPRMLAAA
jgi:hypothetical protein